MYLSGDGVVVAVVVGVSPVSIWIVLTGEAQVVGDGAGDGLGFTPGVVSRRARRWPWQRWSCGWGGPDDRHGREISCGWAHDSITAKGKSTGLLSLVGSQIYSRGLCTGCGIGLGQEMVVIVVSIGDLAKGAARAVETRVVNCSRAL